MGRCSCRCWEYVLDVSQVILRTLILDGRLAKGAVSATTVARLYREAKLPRGVRQDGHTRLRWQADHPGALWHDTVSYCAGTYRIVDYVLAALLVNLGAIDDRFGNYPFVWLALVFWLPLTAWLLWAQRRAGTLWAGAIGFSVSMFVLLFLSRVFQSSYLAWPLTGIGLALLLASGERTSPSPSAAGAAPSAAAE